MFHYQRFNQYFAQVAGGLEEIAAKELKALGATDGEILTRGIDFKADLRDPVPHQLPLAAGHARAGAAGQVRVPPRRRSSTWAPRRSTGPTSSRLDQTFAVFANIFHSEIDHSQFAALKVKDCVVDMFRKRYREQAAQRGCARSGPVDQRAHLREPGHREHRLFGRIAAPARLPAGVGRGAHAGDPGRGDPRHRRAGTASGPCTIPCAVRARC